VRYGMQLTMTAEAFDALNEGDAIEVVVGGNLDDRLARAGYARTGEPEWRVVRDGAWVYVWARTETAVAWPGEGTDG